MRVETAKRALALLRRAQTTFRRLSQMPSFDSQPKAFLWSKSGRRRSSTNVKLLSARADATAIPSQPLVSPKCHADASTPSPPLLSRRRTLCDASDLDALERRNLNDVLERRKLKHLASFLDTVPSTRSSSASRSYSIGDADFGY